MNFDNAQIIVISLVSIANIALLVWQTRKRMPSEIDKMQAEERDSFSDAAESIVAGARDSLEMVRDRNRELKREKQDLMNYVAVLKKALVDGGQPVPVFTPTDSDQNIPAVKK